MSELEKQTPEQLARTRFSIAKQYWSQFKTDATIALKLLQGDGQWDKQVEQLRIQEGRPCVKTNYIANYIRNLTSRSRDKVLKLKTQNDVVNELLANISSSSNIDNQIDQASFYQITTGLSFLRVFADYQSAYSFNQDIKFEVLPDSTSVLIDPSAKDFLFADAQYCFIISQMSIDQFKQAFPQSKLADDSKYSGKFSDFTNPFVNDAQTITIAEYYYVDYKKSTIYKYANPSTGEVKITQNPKEISDSFIEVNRKVTQLPVIRHCLFDGNEFHDATELPHISRLPVIPVIGEDVWIGHKREIYGAVKNAIDAQKLLNYTTSIALEVADLQARTPWVAEYESIADHIDVWETANTRNWPVLPYKKGSQPPQRNSVNTDITALMSLKTAAAGDLQQIFGVFDTQLGADSKEVSGVAINAKNDAGTKSSYVYKDNLKKALAEVGKIIVEMIPDYYNGRNINVSSPFGEKQIKVQLSLLSEDYVNGVINGVQVTETATDSNTRQETNKLLMELSSANAQIAPVLIDAIVENSDIPNKDELKSRVISLLPPEIQATIKLSPEQAIAQNSQLNNQLQSAQQQLQDLQAQIEDMQKTIDQNNLEQQKLALDKQKAEMDYDIKSKQLLIQKTELEVESNLKMHELTLNQEKLVLEANGIQTDQLTGV